MPLVVGLGEAFRNVSDENKASEQRFTLSNNSELLWKALKNIIPDIHLNGPDLKLRHPGNLNIYFPGVLASDLLLSVQPHICASSGSACSSGSIEPSYVLLALGYPANHASCSVRFSVSVETPISDLENAANIIGEKYIQLLNSLK